MPIAKLITRLCLFAALTCAALVVLAVGVGGGTLYRQAIVSTSTGNGNEDIYYVDIDKHIAVKLIMPPPVWRPHP